MNLYFDQPHFPIPCSTTPSLSPQLLFPSNFMCSILMCMGTGPPLRVWAASPLGNLFLKKTKASSPQQSWIANSSLTQDGTSCAPPCCRLGSGLAWSCSSLLHPVAAALSSCEQQYIRQLLPYSRLLLWLLKFRCLLYIMTPISGGRNMLYRSHLKLSTYKSHGFPWNTPG